MSIDVIKLAREAAQGRHATSDADAHSLRADELPRFAALVLEEAAQLAERTPKMSAYFAGEAVQDHIAAVIRALKPQE